MASNGGRRIEAIQLMQIDLYASAYAIGTTALKHEYFWRSGHLSLAQRQRHHHQLRAGSLLSPRTSLNSATGQPTSCPALEA